MATFRFTIIGTYDVDDEMLEGSYGTTDLAECAAIDAANARDYPADFLDSLEDVAISVEPASP